MAYNLLPVSFVKITELIIAGTVSFAVIGIGKALIEPLAKKFTQRKLLKVAPFVLKKLDLLLPVLIKDGISGEELDQRVRKFFENATGEDWSRVNIDPFFQLYDLRKALDFQKIS